MDFVRYVTKLGGKSEDIEIYCEKIGSLCGPCNEHLSRFGRIERKPHDSFSIVGYSIKEKCNGKSVVIHMFMQSMQRFNVNYGNVKKDYLVINPLRDGSRLSEDSEYSHLCDCDRESLAVRLLPERAKKFFGIERKCHIIEDIIWKKIHEELMEDGMSELIKRKDVSYLIHNPNVVLPEADIDSDDF